MAEGKIHEMYPENSHVHYKYEEISINERNSLAEQAQDIAVRQRFWHIHSGDIVFDIGAGFGTYTLCALARGAAFVYAFETNPNVMRALRANLSRNQHLNAVEKCSTCSWRVDDNPHSIDRFVENMSAPPPRLSWIKIDTGDRAANINVLQGARKTVQQYHPNVLLQGLREDVAWLSEYGNILYSEETGHGFAVYEQPK
jgi:hypothetical protein